MGTATAAAKLRLRLLVVKVITYTEGQNKCRGQRVPEMLFLPRLAKRSKQRALSPCAVRSLVQQLSQVPF